LSEIANSSQTSTKASNPTGRPGIDERGKARTMNTVPSAIQDQLIFTFTTFGQHVETNANNWKTGKKQQQLKNSNMLRLYPASPNKSG
jgi:hypothetical protein